MVEENLLIKPKKKRSLHPSVFVLIGYLGVIFFGGILLVLPFAVKSGKNLLFLDALFTSANAVCITGLRLFDFYSTFTLFGQIVLLLLIQIGGLGFMTLASLLFLALKKRISFKERLLIQESLNKQDLSGVVKLVKHLVIISVAIETVGAACLLGVFLPTMQGNIGLGVWRSVFHSVSAFCNCGMDIIGESGFLPLVNNPLFNIITMLLVILGGLGIGVAAELFSFKKEKLSLNTKIVVFGSLFFLAFGGIGLLLTEWNNPETLGQLGVGGKIWAAFFQSAALRTSGFSTIRQSGLSNGGHLISVFLIFVGAGPASTGGGIRLTTFFVVALTFWAIITGKENIIFAGREISRKTSQKAVAIVLMFFVLTGLSVFILSFTETGLTLEQLTLECISALSSAGIDTGATALLSVAGKIVVGVLVLLARAGYLSLALMFTKTNSVLPTIKYPEVKIIIG